MELKNLRTFILVAELSSFTKAADRLGFSQSTVSFQIKQLETELDVRLFERINHTVKLTEQGREVLQYAHQADKLTQELMTSLRAEKAVTGHVRLAMADSLCMLLGETLYRFQLLYPGISLQIITTGTREMFRLLDHNEVDLVFTLDNHIYQPEYLVIREEKIGTHFVAAPTCPLAAQEQVSLQQLLSYPFLLTEKGMSYRRLMDERLAERSMEIRPVLEAGNTELLCRLVAQGAGCSFLPDFTTAEAVRQRRIVRLPVQDFQIDIWKQFFCHRDKWISPQLQTVIEYFAQI